MSRRAKTFVTPEEYLAFERRAENKNEYYGGEIVAMKGFNRSHCLITGNIASGLWQRLKESPCEVYASKMRTKIPAANVYAYPDVVAVCGEPECEDAEDDTLLNPTLIIEVLSESTAAYDRAEKFGYYRTLPSLAEYLLVSQDEYHVTQHVKQPDGRWLLTDIRGLESRVELASVQCVLALSEAYDRVSLG